MIKLKHLLPECEDCGRDWNHGHDHEASMAKNELRDMISNASKIDQLVGQSDELPGWVSAYISLAADYMHSVAEYLGGEASQMGPQEPGPGYAMDEAIGSRTFTYKDARGKEKMVTAGDPDEAKEKVKRFGGDVNSVKEKSASLPVRPKMDEASKKPSAGLTKAEKSTIAKKAHAGKDIGKKGPGFEKVAKAAGGGEKGQKIAAAAMWKNVKR